MSLETTLSRIDSTLAALLVIAQTSAAATLAFGTSATIESLPAVVKATKTKAVKEAPAIASPGISMATSPLGLVDGDPVGTRYWLIEAHNTVYAEHPGMPGCSIGGAVITTAEEYLSKKAEFAKKSLVQPATVAPTAAPVAASTQVATASTASLPVETVSFKDVTDEMMVLARDERPGRGRGAIVTLLAKFLPDVPAAERRVSGLVSVNKNLEVLSEIRALLAADTAPAAVVENDIFA